MKNIILATLLLGWSGGAAAQSAEQPVIAARPTTPAARAAVAEMARLIQEHAFIHLGTATFRYQTRIDTVQGLKLYIGEEVTVIWSRTESGWYCLDLAQPLAADDLRLEELKKGGNFSLLASKRITRFLRHRREAKSKDLLVIFYRAKQNRTTDFPALRARLGYLIEQLPRE